MSCPEGQLLRQKENSLTGRTLVRTASGLREPTSWSAITCCAQVVFHYCHICATNLCDKSFLTLILVILRELEKLRSKCDRRCGGERRLPGRQWRSPCCQGVVCRLSVCICWVFVLVLLFLCWQSNWTSFKVPVVTRIQMASSSWRGWSASALAVAMCKLLKLRRIFYPIFRNRPGVFSRVKCFVNWISKVQQEVSEKKETADSAVKFPE